MRAEAFWRTVTLDRSDFLDSLITLLEQRGIRYCAIGGQAVNAYVEPLVSLDLDLVIAMDQLAEAESVLASHFRSERFPHSLNLSAPGSSLRVQIQTDPRYFPFVDRAQQREILGILLPVAEVGDILRGKVWAALDPAPRPSKRRKDILDIERILEAYPGLRPEVPAEILARLD